MSEDGMGILKESAVITLVMFLFLFLISGKKTFTYFFHRAGYSIKALMPTLLFPALFMVMGIINFAIDRPALNPNWKTDLLLFAGEMFLVGIYEETCFRGCAGDALLPAFRKLKHPFFLTALISSLMFGYVHVVNVDWSDLQQVLQFVLKIATTALSGAASMIVYWKTRSLLGIGIVHFLNDFLPGFLDEIFLFANGSESGTYISGDMGTTVIYAVQLLFDLWAFYRVYKKVWPKINKQKTLEEW